MNKAFLILLLLPATASGQTGWSSRAGARSGGPCPCDTIDWKAAVSAARYESTLDCRSLYALIECQRAAANELSLNQFGRVRMYPSRPVNVQPPAAPLTGTPPSPTLPQGFNEGRSTSSDTAPAASRPAGSEPGRTGDDLQALPNAASRGRSRRPPAERPRPDRAAAQARASESRRAPAHRPRPVAGPIDRRRPDE